MQLLDISVVKWLKGERVKEYKSRDTECWFRGDTLALFNPLRWLVSVMRVWSICHSAYSLSHREWLGWQEEVFWYWYFRKLFLIMNSLEGQREKAWRGGAVTEMQLGSKSRRVKKSKRGSSCWDWDFYTLSLFDSSTPQEPSSKNLRRKARNRTIVRQRTVSGRRSLEIPPHFRFDKSLSANRPKSFSLSIPTKTIEAFVCSNGP